MSSLPSLPDDILVSLLSVLSSRSNGRFTHSLVCRRWAALATSSQLHVTSRQSALLAGYELQHELSQFASLTSLRLSSRTLHSIEDGFLTALSRQHPQLASLVLEGRCCRGPHVSSAELHSFLEDSRNLSVLRLPRDSNWVLRVPGADPPGLEFPPAPSLTQLEVLECSVASVPESIGTLQNLTSVRLHSNTAEALDESLFFLTKVRHLALDFPRISTVSPSIGNMTSLLSLTLHCLAVTLLPPAVFALPRVKRLTLNCNIKEMVCPEESAKVLPELRALSISECDSLSGLPGCFLESRGKLTCLEVGNALKGMEGGFSSLPQLKILTIRNLDDEELPCTISTLKQLTRLHVAGCQNLEQLPRGLTAVPKLRILEVTNCNELTQLPERRLLELSSLESIRLSCCQSLTTLPFSLSSMELLTSLELRSCYEIKRLPETLGVVASLRVLVLDDLQLEALPESLRRLELEEFIVVDCPNLECSQ